jgi:acyl-CoA thioesterase
MNINYRSPVKEGMNLIAEASEESVGRKTALYRMIVKTDDGKLIASSQGTVFIINES